MQACHHCDPASGKRRHPSSYNMQNPNTVFRALDLKPGDVFLDAGCGLGEYSLEGPSQDRGWRQLSELSV